MRHRIATNKLNRKKGHLVALRRNLISALFEHGQITTTRPKALHIQAQAEKLITLARKGTLHARRLVIARMQDRDIPVAGTDEWTGVVNKLMDEIAPKYADREGGYTRLIGTSKKRIGDGAELVVLQLVDPAEAPRKKPTNVTGRRRRAKARYALAEKRGKKSSQPAEQPADEQPAVEAELNVEAPAVEPPAEPQGEEPKA